MHIVGHDDGLLDTKQAVGAAVSLFTWISQSWASVPGWVPYLSAAYLSCLLAQMAYKLLRFLRS